MSGPRGLRVNTVELLRVPGTRREVDVALGPDELGLSDPRLVSPVEVSVVVESTTDGIVVGGSIGVTWNDECRRCLRPLRLHEAADVDELHQPTAAGAGERDGTARDPDAFVIGPEALDLSPLVRDIVLLVLADPPPLCTNDCAGICAICGADRNDVDCGCDTSVRDERWAALDGLDVDPN